MSAFVNDGKQVSLAEAMFDNESDWQDELSFKRGDVLRVLDTNPAQGSAQGWWVCADRLGRCGIAPANRLRMMDDADFFHNTLGRRSFDDFSLFDNHDFFRGSLIFKSDPFFMNRSNATRLNPDFEDDIEGMAARFRTMHPFPLHDANHPLKIALKDGHKSASSSDADDFLLNNRKPSVRNIPINIESRMSDSASAKNRRPKSPPAPPLRRHMSSSNYAHPVGSTNSSEEDELRAVLSNRNIAALYDPLPPTSRRYDSEDIYSTPTNRAEVGVADNTKAVGGRNDENSSYVTNRRRFFESANKSTDHFATNRTRPTDRNATDARSAPPLLPRTDDRSAPPLLPRTDDRSAPPLLSRTDDRPPRDPFALYDRPPVLRRAQPAFSTRDQRPTNRVRFAQNLERDSPTSAVLHSPSSSAPLFSAEPPPPPAASSSSDRSSNSTTVSSTSESAADGAAAAAGGGSSKKSIINAKDWPRKSSTTTTTTTTNVEGRTDVGSNRLTTSSRLKDGANGFDASSNGGPAYKTAVDGSAAEKSIDRSYDVPKNLSQLLNGLSNGRTSTDSSNNSYSSFGCGQAPDKTDRVNGSSGRAAKFLDVDYDDDDDDDDDDDATSKTNTAAFDDDYDFVDNSTTRDVDVSKNDKTRDALGVKQGDVGKASQDDRQRATTEDCVEIARFYAPQIQSQCERLGAAIDDFLASVETPASTLRDGGSDCDAVPAAAPCVVRDVVSRARFLVLAAHKLVYLGDSLAHCARQRSPSSSPPSSSSRAASVATPCDALCAALRRFVAATKRACSTWPRVDDARQMYDCVLLVSRYARQLAVASAQLAAVS